jgi:cyclopropane fatty-acyl-phospholipid synthase-like methyltransferase
MMGIDLYKKRYEFNGNLNEAFFAVGDNEEFEVENQPRLARFLGLKPEHKFLDLGCGCLRGTAKLLAYLNRGNFHGADVSRGLLDMAEERLKKLKIRRTPHLWEMVDFNLEKLINEKFDFVMSISLLTHILPHDLDKLFIGVRDILKPDGVWYFSMYPVVNQLKNHEGDIDISRYDKNFLKTVGKKVGLHIEDIHGDFDNPVKSNQYLEKTNTPFCAQWIMKATLPQGSYL